MRVVVLPLLALVCCLNACDEEEQLARRIERHTPTELPPITSIGANTMGAYVTVDGERHLFVASGVDRNESVGSISADCKPFNNYLYQESGDIVVAGVWCSRPEIERPLQMDMGILFPTKGDSLGMRFGIDYDGVLGNRRVSYGSYGHDVEINLDLAMLDTITQLVAGTFSGYVLNFDNIKDTAFITEGRFDVRYGVTP